MVGLDDFGEEADDAAGGIEFAAALALVPQAEALQMSKKAIRNPGIFGIKIARTDMAFYGRADAILSISFQEYVPASSKKAARFVA